MFVAPRDGDLRIDTVIFVLEYIQSSLLYLSAQNPLHVTKILEGKWIFFKQMAREVPTGRKGK